MAEFYSSFGFCIFRAYVLFRNGEGPYGGPHGRDGILQKYLHGKKAPSKIIWMGPITVNKRKMLQVAKKITPMSRIDSISLFYINPSKFHAAHALFVTLDTLTLNVFNFIIIHI